MASKDKKDISTIALWVAIGFAIGGVAMVPLSKLLLPEPLQTSIEINGQFGDFVGGLLNPIIALLAFTWLRKGVLTQQAELQETKAALAAAAKSQSEQVQISAVAALLQMSSTSIDLVNKRIEEIREDLNKAKEEFKKLPLDVIFSTSQLGQRTYWEKSISELEIRYKHAMSHLERLHKDQDVYKEKLEALAPMFIVPSDEGRRVQERPAAP